MENYYELSRDRHKHVYITTLENDCFPAHFHASIELTYVEKGEICVLQDGEFSKVTAGRLIVNSCYTLHSYDTPQQSTTLVVIIPLSAVPVLAGMMLHHEFAKKIVDLSENEPCRALITLIAEQEHNGNIYLKDSLAQALLALLIEQVGLVENHSDAERSLIRETLTYLSEHAAEPVTVRSIAARFGYSEGRFSHVFNQRVGCSFPCYLNELRSRMACRMLKESDLPLTEIAEMCGFSSMRSFHRVIKQQTGKTPFVVRGEKE